MMMALKETKMTKCNCYVEETYPTGYDWVGKPCGYKTVCRCNGTKEREECTCGGDESKCNFYPYKREKASGLTVSDGSVSAAVEMTSPKEFYVVKNKDTGEYFRGKGTNRWGKDFNQASVYRLKKNAENAVKSVSWHGDKAEVKRIWITEEK